MRQIIKKLVFPFLNLWYKIYGSKPRIHKRDDVQITVYPGVFNPGIFLSTNILIDFLSQLNINNQKVLELGAGSGFISFYLEKKKNCIVTASDINSKALSGLEKNKKDLNSNIQIIYSNLFEHLTPNDYDVIVVNPPYYPKQAQDEAQNAFYCGEEFEYFHEFFKQLESNWNNNTKVYMILSEDCELDTIQNIGLQNKMAMKTEVKTSKRKEINYIYSINKISE